MQFFDDEGEKPNPFKMFDGHAVYLIAVPHGREILCNGVVLGEITPNPNDAYLNVLIDRSMKNRTAEAKPKPKKGQGNEPQS
ncbi:MAG: hypothetical protein ABL882_00625 [Sphingopyxis sp.]